MSPPEAVQWMSLQTGALWLLTRSNRSPMVSPMPCVSTPGSTVDSGVGAVQATKGQWLDRRYGRLGRHASHALFAALGGDAKNEARG